MSSFKREVFVKDLFYTQGILNHFDEVTFESLSLFLKCFKEGNVSLDLNKNFRIYLNDKELLILEKLAFETEILKANSFTFCISPSLLSNAKFQGLINKNIPFSIRLHIQEFEIYQLISMVDIIKTLGLEWFTKNKVEIYVPIVASNYLNNINCIIEIYNKTPIRFFIIDFNYDSLNNLTFKEFEIFKYKLQDLIKIWAPASYGRRQQNPNVLVAEFANKYKKKIYVSVDRKLYINEHAVTNHDFILDLELYSNKTNGENIGVKELNLFRAYLDLPGYVTPFLTDEQKKSWPRSLIDPYYNKLLTQNYTIVPSITKLLILSLI